MSRHTLKAWIVATRPWSFPASAMPVLATTAYLFWQGHETNFVFALWTIINIIVFHAAGNTWSDYNDYCKGVDREDTIGGMSIVSGEFNPSEIRSLAMVLLVVASLSGIALVLCTGLPTLYLGIVGGLLTALYPWLKYHALGDVDIFLCYSLLPILGTSYVVCGDFYMESLWLSVPIGLITVGILHSNNMRDIEHDRRAGIRTFAMIMGKRLSAYILCAELLLPFVWVICGAVAGIYPWWSLLVLIALKPAIENSRKAMRFVDGDSSMLYGVDEMTAKLQLMFSLLLAVSLFIDYLI